MAFTSLLQRCLFCAAELAAATLRPVQPLISSIHSLCGLPRFLFASTIPWIIPFSKRSCIITWPKNLSFLSIIWLLSTKLLPILSRTPSELCDRHTFRKHPLCPGQLWSWPKIHTHMMLWQKSSLVAIVFWALCWLLYSSIWMSCWL